MTSNVFGNHPLCHWVTPALSRVSANKGQSRRTR